MDPSSTPGLAGCVGDASAPMSIFGAKLARSSRNITKKVLPKQSEELDFDLFFGSCTYNFT
jgi:hypothetical protein